MGQPVKVPQVLYEALRKRSEEDRITLQEALVRSIEQGSRDIEGFRGALTELTNELKQVRKTQETVQKALNEARQSLGVISAKVQGLSEARGRDLDAWESWVPTWQEISELSEVVEETAKGLENANGRIRKLERSSHRHLLQSSAD